MSEKQRDCSVALSYILGSKVPIIVASGKDEVAHKIREIAIKENIEIVYNDKLANILVNEEIGTCIPEECYLAVASIFAFLINKKG